MWPSRESMDGWMDERIVMNKGNRMTRRDDSGRNASCMFYVIGSGRAFFMTTKLVVIGESFVD